MAKGDDARMRNPVKYEGDRSAATLGNTRTGVLQPQYEQARNSWVDAIGSQNQERAGITSGYQNFANTGGYSQQDIQDIRNRSTNPLKSVYAGANREVDRSRALQGGYSPGYGVLKARMAREQGQAMADANTNVNASVAKMVNRGKLAAQAGLLNTYAAQPGLVGTFGNQMLGASNQIQQQDALELERMRTQYGAYGDLTRAKGKFQEAMGNVGSVFDTAGKLGTAIGTF